VEKRLIEFLVTIQTLWCFQMNFKFECSSLTATKEKKERMVTEICVWAKRRGEYVHASRFHISPLTCVSSDAKYREMIFINSSFFF
jgi:hypothetical protein